MHGRSQQRDMTHSRFSLSGVRTRAAATVAAAVVLGAAPAAAQTTALGADLFAGSEAESYLRYLQSTGEVAAYPWSIRAFGPAEGDRLVAPEEGHPWAGRAEVRRDSAAGRVRLLPVEARSWFNSAYPFAANDGPVWAGRGVTAAVQAGVAVRAGPVSLVLAPIAYGAQNSEFTLMPNGRTGELRFADGRQSDEIDLPQRFGGGAYGRIDPGQSTLRVDAGPVAAGISTANQVWGPGTEYPLILGNAGPGFPHLFVGSARPLNLWVARVHARVVYGRLDQSAYSTVGPDSAHRFMSGLVAVVQPRGLPGLEVGGARFFHAPWQGGPSAGDFATPFQGILKKSLQLDSAGQPPDGAANQLASVFFRWTVAPAGVEVYGELAREDHSYDLRDLLLEPDHSVAYMLGLRRAWRPRPDRMVAVRAEVADARISRVMRLRSQGEFYTHTPIRQGHTQRGQPLGARAAYGGAGASLAVDLYHPGGRWSAFWLREERGASGAGWYGDPVVKEGRLWVAHALGAESLFRAGPVNVRAGLTGVLELNRYLEERDAFNLNAQLGVQYTP